MKKIGTETAIISTGLARNIGARGVQVGDDLIAESITRRDPSTGRGFEWAINRARSENKLNLPNFLRKKESL